MNKTTEEVLKFLKSTNDFVSGESIAKRVGVSRTAVWKAVNNLKKIGYEVCSITNKGYKLFSQPSFLDKDEIASLINEELQIEILETTSSTNDYIKKYIDGKERLVIAKSQTNGRGRFNRKFFSPKGVGVYMSFLIKPKLKIAESVKITTYTGVVIARAIEKLTGKRAQIKWVNDVFLEGKKICGILTEASCNFESGMLDYAVIGIGINLYKQKFDKSISNIATDVQTATKVKVNVNSLIAEIANGIIKAKDEIQTQNYIKEYKDRCFILNKQITVNAGNEIYEALAVDVADNGGLIVDKEGVRFTVNSGDVSIKL